MKGGEKLTSNIYIEVVQSDSGVEHIIAGIAQRDDLWTLAVLSNDGNKVMYSTMVGSRDSLRPEAMNWIAGRDQEAAAA
jgi:hypothetical protein